MIQDLDFFYFLDIFALLVPFKILSHCLNIDSSHWLQEDVQWIIDKVYNIIGNVSTKFPLKAIEINGVEITGFLKNFVVLMYLFK